MIQNLQRGHGNWSRGAAFNADANGDGVDKVEVKIKRTLAVGGKLFTRLNVTSAP